jgi:hypothetical protein
MNNQDNFFLSKEEDIKAAQAGTYIHNGRPVLVLPTLTPTGVNRVYPSEQTQNQVLTVLRDSGFFYRYDQGLHSKVFKVYKIDSEGCSKWVMWQDIKREVESRFVLMQFSLNSKGLEIREQITSAEAESILSAGMWGNVLKLLKINELMQFRVKAQEVKNIHAAGNSRGLAVAANERYLAGGK